MKSSFRNLLFACLLTQMLPGQTPASHYDPAPAQQNRQQKSLSGFAFGRINPKDTDYGQCIEDVRRIGIEGTLENYYFWSNIAALTAAIGFFIYMVQMRRERKQLLFDTAQVLTKYQNQIATGAQKYRELHQEYSQFLREFEQLKEPKLTSKSAPPKARTVGDNNGDNGSVPKPVGVAAAAQPGPQRPAESQKPDRQIPRDETIANLRQQIGSLAHQLEQERQKNRRLRGE